MTNFHAIRCAPREDKVKKYRRERAAMVEIVGKLVCLEELQAFTELHEFMCRFVDDGRYIESQGISASE